MAASDQLVIPPPTPKLMDYPVSIGLAFAIVFVTALLLVVHKYDPTHGSLTISLLVVMAFIGTVCMSLLFTIPQDQTTAAVIGGLVAAFGAVVSYWLTPRKPPDDKGE